MLDNPYRAGGFLVDSAIGAHAAPSNRAVMPGRELRLDFFRGLALLMIFLDHIPSNVMNWMTIRNFGFSDAAEAFVFMAGFSAALAYGGREAREPFLFTTARILKRAWQLYVAQILLFLLFVAEIALIANSFHNPMFTEEMSITNFFDQPEITVINALLLKFRPTNMDILPLYIVLLGTFPVVLYGLQRKPWWVLIGSFALYAAAKSFDWNLPAWPDGDWLFNPIRWQFLFVIGAALGMRHIPGGPRLEWPWKYKRYLVPVAALFLLASLYIVMSWQFPGLERVIPNKLEAILYPIDKGNEDPFRLVHFFALAYLTVLLVPASARLFETRWAQAVIQCGQHSLEIFCLGLVLSFTAHVALVEISAGLLAQVLVSLVGIAIMLGMGYYLSWYRRTERAATKAKAKQALAG